MKEESTYEKIRKADEELWNAYDNARDKFFLEIFSSSITPVIKAEKGNE